MRQGGASTDADKVNVKSLRSTPSHHLHIHTVPTVKTSLIHTVSEDTHTQGIGLKINQSINNMLFLVSVYSVVYISLVKGGELMQGVVNLSTRFPV